MNYCKQGQRFIAPASKFKTRSEGYGQGHPRQRFKFVSKWLVKLCTCSKFHHFNFKTKKPGQKIIVSNIVDFGKIPLLSL